MNEQTPPPACPACAEKRLHTEEDWQQYHPYRGHGYTKGWSHPGLEPKP